ncbi:MAG: PVC-type heme-binding CxxCH protein, partial [Pirellulaceae bacterium]
MAPWYPWLIVVALAAPNEEAFRSQVRPTEPLAPSDQLRTFHVPPGFEVQLFAAEPDIQKPMNMAFDGAGRLWVSGSIEYPYAAAGDGRDTIKVLEDRDGDGHAETVTTFAEGLNIPIGLYPYRDGVVVYSMPNIWWLRDTDGDGRSDQREVLYGPLDMPRDTHGMQNAFRRGFDGWLYINHGYANDTTIRGRDGSSIHLQSGNTYRVRLDGSRVEQFTWGQVNPFGSTFLPTGDLITADCHSRPLTMLLRGAYYPSFGKPHGGLGFAPDMMEHSHGSTAIAGAAYYTGDQFPAEYRDRLFVG